MKPQILPHGKAQANTEESGVTPEKTPRHGNVQGRR